MAGMEKMAAMHARPSVVFSLTLVLAATWLGASAFAQDKPSAPAETKAAATSQPSAEDMARMMDLSRPGENHKVLANFAGNWNFKTTFWMAPGAPPTESTGSATCKPLMGGRYYLSEANGKFEMPGPDGKMQATDFKGMEIAGYDNVKQKFVSSWIDNMGTSIVILEGTYDPATKTFTYLTEEEMMPGVKTKARELIKFVDHDHYVLEWYEDHGGEQSKTMEIDYVRQG
jgi:hypothetical protein